MAVVLAFVRFCCLRGWIAAVPLVEKLEAEDVMPGRPVTVEEFHQMLDATPQVVGLRAARSWQFALRVLWESGFRIGDLMDFHWDDPRHIHPKWPTRSADCPTILIPSSQKNRRVQEIPLLPGLQRLLESFPKKDRIDWIVNPLPMDAIQYVSAGSFRPTNDDLVALAHDFSNCSISAACGVSETTVRNWLQSAGIDRCRPFKHDTGSIPDRLIDAIRKRAGQRASANPFSGRLTKERVGRVIAMIGEQAGVIVQEDDPRTGRRQKFASAHDIRRGCAQRLINAGISAETLKLIMRHKSFSTTEKHYGALRSAQSAGHEVQRKLVECTNPELVGGFVGGTTEAPRLSPEELLKLKSLLKVL